MASLLSRDAIIKVAGTLGVVVFEFKTDSFTVVVPGSGQRR